jgi:phosphoribosylformimino-5-aminoimidazole carboxamide ribotide isomerase
MIVIPAIDLKDGKCVRLAQGRMDQATIYSEDPVQMAKHWESKGAERLHIVDLDGAVMGRPIHRSLIEEIARSIRIPIEVGGGIRDMETIEQYLSSGARWVILGTAAFQDPDLMRESVQIFPGRIILSLDAKNGRVAIHGWNEIVSLEMGEMVKRFEKVDLSAVIFTDIERDGMGTGLNWELTKTLAQLTTIPVIASGGISRVEDIQHLTALESFGVMGVVVGRALYAGQVDLEEAIRITKMT